MNSEEKLAPEFKIRVWQEDDGSAKFTVYYGDGRVMSDLTEDEVDSFVGSQAFFVMMKMVDAVVQREGEQDG